MSHRAAYHSGADAYLGANEAASLVGAWRQLGSDVQIRTPGREGLDGYHPHHHHHRHHGFGRPGYGQQDYGSPGWTRGRDGGFVPPVYNSYPPPPAYTPPYTPPNYGRSSSYGQPYNPPRIPNPMGQGQGGVTVRDHRTSGDIAALVGAVAELAGGGPSPRAWLRDMPPPDMANRQVLPMNTGTTPVPVNSTAQITSRPQRVAFRPERVFVSSGGIDSQTGQPLSAADWIINDITIGNRSQFAQSGALPGDMFSSEAIDSFVTFETAQTAMDVVMVVTYQGPVEGGIPFYGSIIGTAAL
jgi:hypothetical protein